MAERHGDARVRAGDYIARREHAQARRAEAPVHHHGAVAVELEVPTEQLRAWLPADLHHETSDGQRSALACRRLGLHSP